MTFILRAPRVRRLTASFGLSLTAAGIAIATLIATVSISTSALAGPSKSRSSSTKRFHKAMVRVETARLRSSPGDKSAPTALLDAGRSASVIARKGEWAKLRLGTGREGWVRADLLSISKKTVKVASAPGKPRKATGKQVAKAPKKPVQTALRPVKRVATVKPVSVKRVAAAKPVLRKPAPKKTAIARPVVKPVKTVATAKKPALFAFFRPVARGSVARPSVVDPTIFRTSPAAPESTSAAAAPAQSEAPVDTTANRVESQLPDAQDLVESTSEAAIPMQVAMALPNAEKMAEPVSAAPAKKAAPVNRNLNRNERIARSALSYRGVPYRMGATGRGAFDCSGFMMYLFDKEGLDLPRTAAQQYKKGIPIPKSQLKPGDLVFFKNTYKRGVSHVGIYIGGGKFCHASSGGHAVRTDSLSKSYYVNHWAGARRPR